ncbi:MULTISPECIES: zeta toxin family protein [Delftia]|uniref:zeta toxin family protein n=1 Tax=Delftia TaxID=80865 RepID=UPI000F849503|nr:MULTISPECIES: zeta toxin family protein [Delftia]KAA9181985.1 AAA family ATPase [Delftia sp. BR1]WEL96966.1 zeta toxin family protein [Delftia tsuruhatensis]WQM84898.1 zeta toxin family protein [Delftia tsuruhatensis]
MTNDQVREAAEAWARANKRAFARELTDPQKFPGEESPVSVFMAGSPGAGKTEISKALSAELGDGFLRIDPDDFRAKIPGYTGDNSWLFQGAISILLSRVLDCVFTQKQSFLLDGTLSNLKQATANVERALAKRRSVLIMYVYQDPMQAWEFVKAREATEGRKIPPDRFVEQFFGAHSVVNELKVKFGSQIQIDVILKDIDGKNRRYMANVSDLTVVAPIPYSSEQIMKVVSS